MKKIYPFLIAIPLIVISACAAPPLQYYTLSEIGDNNGKQPIKLSSIQSPFILVTRVTVPDYLDTADIIIRRGAALNRSQNGRMSSVLSVGATELVTHYLAMQRPDALVTNQNQLMLPQYQIIINISRFDLNETSAGMGVATLEANWSIVPENEKNPIENQKGLFTKNGSIKNDSDIIKLQQDALIELAKHIDIRNLR